MTNLRLNKWVAFTQIISSVAVVISIIYLISEFNRSEVINANSVENLIYSRIMELDRLIIENPILSQIISKVEMNSDSLSNSEIRQYLAYEHIFFDSWETLWINYQDGIIEENEYIGWNSWFVNEARKKPKLAFSGNEHHFAEEFLEEIRSQLKSE